MDKAAPQESPKTVSDTAPPLAERPAPAELATRRRAGAGRPRPLLALGTGVVVALLVGVLRAGAVLEGHVALVVAFLLLIAVPSSRLGVRRLLLAAGWAAGVLPALWWWDLPLGSLGRVGLLLAVLAGSLTTVVLWHGPAGARGRVRLLLPSWRPVDLAVAGAAALGALASRGLLSVRSGAEALAALTPAWDNSAHVDMVLMLRHSGAVVPSLAAPAVGEAWKFADYPQGYHAIVATVVELLGAATPGPIADELVLYVRAQGFVLAAVAVVLVAGLCALPAAPRRPVAVTLASAGVAGMFLLGPGASAFTSGFPNFTLGCAMAAAVLLLAVSMPRVTMPVQLAAIGGLLVGVAHSWVLLLALALPAATLIAVPPRRAAWRGTRRERVLSAVVVLLTLGGLAQAVVTLRRLAVAEVLVIPGGIAVPATGLMVALVLASVAATLVPSAGASPRTPWVAAVPVVGLLAAAAIAALQLTSGGELSYYFWKFALGLTLVAAVVLAVGVLGRSPAVTAGPAPAGRAARWRRVGAVTVGCVALLQVHGLTGRSTGDLRIAPDQLAQATDLLQAAETSVGAGLADAVYVRAGAGLHPVNAQQWLLALTGTWTLGSERRATDLISAGTPADVAALALANGATLVVAPGDVSTLGLAGTPADRFVTWGS